MRSLVQLLCYILLLTFCLVCFYEFILRRSSFHVLSENKILNRADPRIDDFVSPDPRIDAFVSQSHQIGLQCGTENRAKDRIVFIKTHKTASTTLASIFERYGYSRNLTFGVGVGTHVISSYKLFKRHMIHQSNSRHQYHFLTNHVRYNRKEMEAVFPNATYVTILRNPVSQFESAFGYFNFANSAHITNSEDPIGTFFTDPDKFYNTTGFFFKNQAKNGQIFDLGLDTSLQNDRSAFNDVFKSLKQELDFVLISEYFNHSLVLMKQKLCWQTDDILYISKGIRNSHIRYQLKLETKERIKAWNALDMQLYNYYNETLWRKISEYGSMFWDDLKEFENRLEEIQSECIDTSKRDVSDYREDNIVVKDDAGEFCKALALNDVEYSRLIRKRQGLDN
ncbi:galactosylceramide sulfotransferase-like [Anneissia japonica]|uniref:galactosylceramide sulfotransferase-like n=1 Tax=Anneissia japonica TaxID=1529436 RepID=UPI0014259E5F|nr:galactosylceramide sulfotransferase-like [Anneissia japonica]